METLTTLVIEDNPGDARLIEEYLKMDTSVNYSISFTTTLAGSLEALSNKKFNVILVDLGLPDSQGMYTFHEIINASPRSPIVIITGTDNEKMGLEAIREGAQNYLVKNQINSTLLIRTIKFAIEIKRKNVELKESKEKYHSIFEGAASLIISVGSSGEIIDCNKRIQQLLGYSKEEVIGQPVKMIIHPDSREKAKKSILEVFEKGSLCTGEYKMTKKDGEAIFVNIHSSALKDENNKNVMASCIIDDITQRMLYEKNQLFTAKILSILNRRNEWHKLITDILDEIREFSGIEAVGIRHKEGEDYPYFSSIGFSDSFIRKENFLCTRNVNGELVYDSDGKIILECMCGNIISKRTNPSLSFFTEAGSFWTNSTTNLLATTTDKERQTHTRNHCNASGYESVALIPLVSENETFGLLQLNDKRKNMFTEEMIHFFEDIGSVVGIAFKRIQAEKRIGDSEDRYRRLFECARDGIIILDADTGEILDANPYLTIKLGFSREEFLSKKLWEIGSFKDIVPSKKEFEKLQKEQYIRNDDLLLETKNGEKFFVEFISNGYHTKNAKVIQCNIRDITERKEFEEALIGAKEKAEESDSLKTAFLHNISHEIRTPMNAIVGFSELLHDPDLDCEKRMHYTEIICQGSNQLLSIITDIVNIATIEAGQMKIIEKEINLNHLLNEIFQQYETDAEKKGIEFQIKYGLPDIASGIITDDTKLMQILSNLINNALKFTNNGYVRFGYLQKKDKIEFFVEDSGIGIPADMHEKIFERFRQADSSISREYGGTGLGLSISLAYVKLMAGEIWIESEPAKGSVFFFNIPYKKVVKNKFEGEKITKDTVLKFNQLKTVLVAEDEENNYLLIEEYLNESNISLLWAKNGVEAVDICNINKTIDLIFMDIKMPRMNGYDATRKIKALNPLLPVIAVTAYTQSEDTGKAIESGCSDYLSKPVRKDELVSVIAKYLKE